MSAYVKTIKVKDEDKDEKNKLISFRIFNDKLLENYRNIWTKMEETKKIELNPLTVYENKCIKTKKRKYGDKFYTNFRGSKCARRSCRM